MLTCVSSYMFFIFNNLHKITTRYTVEKYGSIRRCGWAGKGRNERLQLNSASSALSTMPDTGTGFSRR